eukprot:gene2364-2920_t
MLLELELPRLLAPDLPSNLVAISQAPSPESNPDSPLPVTTMGSDTVDLSRLDLDRQHYLVSPTDPLRGLPRFTAVIQKVVKPESLVVYHCCNEPSAVSSQAYDYWQDQPVKLYLRSALPKSRGLPDAGPEFFVSFKWGVHYDPML